MLRDGNEVSIWTFDGYQGFFPARPARQVNKVLLYVWFTPFAAMVVKVVEWLPLISKAGCLNPSER